MGGESGKNADSDSGGLEWGLADKNPCDDTAASKDIQIFFFLLYTCWCFLICNKHITDLDNHENIFFLKIKHL